MASNTGPQTEALRELVAELPNRVADWSPEQRAEFSAQSDRSMREQNSTDQPGQLS